ncbi:UNVERIFIED_CONTAM: hypothetical protein K2H54_013803 [Gekko kuhli]
MLVVRFGNQHSRKKCTVRFCLRCAVLISTGNPPPPPPRECSNMLLGGLHSRVRFTTEFYGGDKVGVPVQGWEIPGDFSGRPREGEVLAAIQFPAELLQSTRIEINRLKAEK